MEKIENEKIIKKAFTLAEVAIVLIVLGTVATITLSALIRNNTLSINRTKLKKTAATYDAVIRRIAAENRRLNTESKINNWGKDCANIRSYFQIVETGDTECQFSSDDGVWWDFGANPNGASMTKALVAFKKEDLTKAKAIDEGTNDAFFLMTQFDDNHSPRVMDIQYAFYTGNSVNILNDAKVYAFIDKKKISDYFKYCNETNISCMKISGTNCYFHDHNGTETMTRSGCPENNNIGLFCNKAGNTTYKEGGIWTDKYAKKEYNYYSKNVCDKQGDECDTCEKSNKYCKEFQYIEEIKSGNEEYANTNNMYDYDKCGIKDVPVLKNNINKYNFEKEERNHIVKNCNAVSGECLVSINDVNSKITDRSKIIGCADKNKNEIDCNSTDKKYYITNIDNIREQVDNWYNVYDENDKQIYKLKLIEVPVIKDGIQTTQYDMVLYTDKSTGSEFVQDPQIRYYNCSNTWTNCKTYRGANDTSSTTCTKTTCP